MPLTIRACTDWHALQSEGIIAMRNSDNWDAIASTAIILVAAAAAPAQPVRQEWVARYDYGIGNSEHAVGVTVDAEGNVSVAAHGYGGDSDWDYLVIQYDESGERRWLARYDGPGRGQDFAAASAQDTDGNIYITGRSDGDGTSADFATVKYDSRGNEVWVARYDAGDDDMAVALALDDDGHLYVTGNSWGGETSTDFATVKYDLDGRELWVARYNGPTGTGFDTPAGIAVDTDGFVYVTGASFAGRGFFDIDYTTIKYDPDGHMLWAVQYNGETDDSDRATAIAVDDAGGVYVTGTSREGAYLFATVKYDSGGNLLWTSKYADPRAQEGNLPYAMALDGDGHLYVTGSSYPASGYRDFATVKLDADTGKLSRSWPDAGDGRGVRRYAGEGGGSDVPLAMVVDALGDVYVAGFVRRTPMDSSYVTLKYSAGGELLWQADYNGPGSQRGLNGDVAYAIAVDERDFVYVTGGSWGAGNTYVDVATIKYSQWPCTGHELIKAQCKAGRGGFVLTAKVKKGTPGDVVDLCLDDGGCFELTLNPRGQTRVRWGNVRQGGAHTVSADFRCGASKRVEVTCSQP